MMVYKVGGCDWIVAINRTELRRILATDGEGRIESRSRTAKLVMPYTAIVVHYEEASAAKRPLGAVEYASELAQFEHSVEARAEDWAVMYVGTEATREARLLASTEY